MGEWTRVDSGYFGHPVYSRDDCTVHLTRYGWVARLDGKLEVGFGNAEASMRWVDERDLLHVQD